jgi:hypothetical protein
LGHCLNVGTVFITTYGTLPFLVHAEMRPFPGLSARIAYLVTAL